MKITKYSIKLVREVSAEYESIKGMTATNPIVSAEAFEKIFDLSSCPQETLVMLSLDNRNQIIGANKISVGGLSSTIVEPKNIFQYALLQNAAAIVIAHNHPSGVLEPSNDDIRLTATIEEAGDFLGIQLLDHLILGERNYLSMKEEGIF
jgi:DNA repair protein RadC